MGCTTLDSCLVAAFFVKFRNTYLVSFFVNPFLYFRVVYIFWRNTCARLVDTNFLRDPPFPQLRRAFITLKAPCRCSINSQKDFEERLASVRTTSTLPREQFPEQGFSGVHGVRAIRSEYPHNEQVSHPVGGSEAPRYLSRPRL